MAARGHVFAAGGVASRGGQARTPSFGFRRPTNRRWPVEGLRPEVAARAPSIARTTGPTNRPPNCGTLYDRRDGARHTLGARCSCERAHRTARTCLPSMTLTRMRCDPAIPSAASPPLAALRFSRCMRHVAPRRAAGRLPLDTVRDSADRSGRRRARSSQCADAPRVTE